MKNGIYTQTPTEGNKAAYKKITNKQWKVYYYLLSVSKFNSMKVEDHRYIYKSEINKTATCKMLGIKSVNTYNDAIEKLKDKGLIRELDTTYLIYAKDYVEVNKDVLINLLKFSCMKDSGIDLLRTYLALKYIFILAPSKAAMCFTKADIISLLGHNKKTGTYYLQVQLYLALLSYWGLIELKQHRQYDKNIKPYTIYHIENVKENNLNPDFESDIETEMMNSVLGEELFNKIKDKMPQLIDNEWKDYSDF